MLNQLASYILTPPRHCGRLQNWKIEFRLNSGKQLSSSFVVSVSDGGPALGRGGGVTANELGPHSASELPSKGETGDQSLDALSRLLQAGSEVCEACASVSGSSGRWKDTSETWGSACGGVFFPLSCTGLPGVDSLDLDAGLRDLRLKGLGGLPVFVGLGLIALIGLIGLTGLIPPDSWKELALDRLETREESAGCLGADKPQ